MWIPVLCSIKIKIFIVATGLLDGGSVGRNGGVDPRRGRSLAEPPRRRHLGTQTFQPSPHRAVNTSVPPFTAEADNCHIQRQRGGIGPAGARGPPGVQKPAPLSTSRNSQRRGCGEGTNYNDSLMDRRTSKRPLGLSKCCNR